MAAEPDQRVEHPLVRRLADALARVAQNYGEDVDSERLLADEDDTTEAGERRVQ